MIKLEKTVFAVNGKRTTDLRKVNDYMAKEGLTSLDDITGTTSIEKANIIQDNVAIDKQYFTTADVNIDGVITDATVSGKDTDTASQNADNSNNSGSGNGRIKVPAN